MMRKMAEYAAKYGLYFSRYRVSSQKRQVAIFIVMQRNEMRRTGTFSLFLCLNLFLFSCSGAPAITVHNGSSATISNVSLKGNGFAETIESLKPGSSVSITVHPKGESDLAIQFDTPEGKKGKDGLAYFEASGGYRIIIEINDRFEIKAKGTIGA
jgi:hypothetical protein